MKKYFIIAAAALATLASCTEIEKDQPQAQIAFKAFNYKSSTKAAIESTTFPTTADFKVYAAYTASNYAKGAGTQYINGVKCTYTEATDIWDAETPSYWPLSGYLTFAAVSPAKYGTWADKLASLTVTDFTSAGQDDLMFCAPSDCADKQKNDTDYVGTQGDESTTNQYGVPLVFHHALSLVEVRAKAKDGLTNVKFEITGLELTVGDKATLTVTDNYGSDPAYAAAWGTTSDSYTNGSFLKTGVELASAETTSYVTVTDEKVLVVPQTLGDTQKLKVTYKMYYGTVEAGSKTVEVKLKTDELTALQINKKYIINLELNADVIRYAPSIADWDSTTVEEEYEVK